MGRIGTGENGQLTFLDLISILSFWIGVENFDMNVTQEDMQKNANRLDAHLRKEVDDIHSHLSIQDAKLNHIVSILEELKNDKN